MIYFTSDLHLGHKNVIAMCSRPFENADCMDDVLINNWDSLINEDDEVYVLGDITLARGWKTATCYLKQLKGKKYLIKGNHDKYLYDLKFDRRQFELITPYHEIDFNGHKLILCHYPLADWNGKFRGSIHLHGHIHSPHWSTLQEIMGRIFDVGVDANNYFPISIDTIIEHCMKIETMGLIEEYITRRNG